MKRGGDPIMLSPDALIVVYKELADWHDDQGEAEVRDRFLVLAADAALHAGRSDEAERLRRQLLSLNPHHLLRPYATFAEALTSSDVQGYIGELRWKYPPTMAEKLLEKAHSKEAEAAPRRTQAIPGTAPVLNLDPPTAKVVDGEPPPVYRLHPEEPPAPPRKSAPIRKTTVAGPPPTARPAAPPRYEPPPTPRVEAPPLPSQRIRDEDDVVVGAWFSTMLFTIVLIAGLALGVYAFVGPFLPPTLRP